MRWMVPVLFLVGCGGRVEQGSADASTSQDAFSDVGRPEVAPDAADASDGQPDVTDAGCECRLWGAEIAWMCGDDFQGVARSCQYCDARCGD